VEQVLLAGDLGAVRGVPELLEADVAQADTDALAQLAGVVAGVPEDTDLADDRELTRIGVARCYCVLAAHLRSPVKVSS